MYTFKLVLAPYKFCSAYDATVIVITVGFSWEECSLGMRLLRMLYCIAPFSPAGQNLPLENMKEIVRFCHKEGLLLFSDEVLTHPPPCSLS